MTEDWGHVIIETAALFLTTGITSVVALWIFRKQDRAEREKIRFDAEDRRQQLHNENMKRFEELLDEANERPHHKHTEGKGTLTAEGISYAPPKRFNGSGDD
jgi:hypothetical protein